MALKGSYPACAEACRHSAQSRVEHRGQVAGGLTKLPRLHRRLNGFARRQTMGEMRSRMLRGELYVGGDPESAAEFARVQELVARFNRSSPGAWDERDGLLRKMLRVVGEGVVVRPSFYCEYGAISIGSSTFVNVDAVMLDVAPIVIGEACQIATRVQLLTATHPIDPEPRRAGWEYGEPIALADNVWLGGGVIVCPGVSIGEDTVVGAGAVVARNLPAGVIAAGVPARILRE